MRNLNGASARPFMTYFAASEREPAVHAQISEACGG
jgi:hypothetical protein